MTSPNPAARRARGWAIAGGAVLLAGIVALLVAVAGTPVGQEWWDAVKTWLDDATDWFQGLLS